MRDPTLMSRHLDQRMEPPVPEVLEAEVADRVLRFVPVYVSETVQLRPGETVTWQDFRWPEEFAPATVRLMLVSDEGWAPPPRRLDPARTVWIAAVPLPYEGWRTVRCGAAGCNEKFRGPDRHALYELHYRQRHLGGPLGSAVRHPQVGVSATTAERIHRAVMQDDHTRVLP